jgi:predicted metal-binding protein
MPLRMTGGASLTLLICTRCNWTGSEAERAGPRSGKALLDLVAGLADGGTKVQAGACLSGYKRACAIGVVVNCATVEGAS